MVSKNAQLFNINAFHPFSDAQSAFEDHQSILRIKFTLTNSNNTFDFKNTINKKIMREIKLHYMI